jgi:hypothetical protein
MSTSIRLMPVPVLIFGVKYSLCTLGNRLVFQAS